MSDADQMIDSVELRELRGAFSGVPLPDAPPLDRITARGNARRRHRRYGVAVVSVACVTAATALVLGLTDGRVAPASKLAAIRTSAYTLVSNADGTATLTVNPAELFDPVTLQSDLEKYGIPAKVTVGSICSTDPPPTGFPQVYSYDPGPPGGDAVITIDPTAIPAGAELSFGEVPLRSGPRAAEVGLIDKNSFTCSSTFPFRSGDQGANQGAGWYRIPAGSNASTHG